MSDGLDEHTWNYRIVRKNGFYTVREAHYTNGKLRMYIKPNFYFDSVRYLVTGLYKVARDCWRSRHDVLEYDPKMDRMVQIGGDL